MLFSIAFVKLLILGALLLCAIGALGLVVLLFIDWRSGNLW